MEELWIGLGELDGMGCVYDCVRAPGCVCLGTYALRDDETEGTKECGIESLTTTTTITTK